MAVDEERRRAIRNELRARERAARIAHWPLTEADLRDLVGAVDAHVVEHGCDHSATAARRWADDHGTDWESMAPGLAALGGYCDCEIVLNCDADDVFAH